MWATLQCETQTWFALGSPGRLQKVQCWACPTWDVKSWRSLSCSVNKIFWSEFSCVLIYHARLCTGTKSFQFHPTECHKSACWACPTKMLGMPNKVLKPLGINSSLTRAGFENAFKRFPCRAVMSSSSVTPCGCRMLIGLHATQWLQVLGVHYHEPSRHRIKSAVTDVLSYSLLEINIDFERSVSGACQQYSTLVPVFLLSETMKVDLHDENRHV